VTGSSHFVPVLTVRLSNFGDGWHRVPGHAEASGHLVPGMWFVTSQKNGASALGLQRVLGLGGYRTAWSWLHKLRRAMVRSWPRSTVGLGAYRRLAGLRRIREEGMRSRSDVGPETTAQRSFHSPASGTPGRFASEAVAGRYAPGGGVTRASALLPRRVYVSL
jgi:hypothetical protein